MTLGISCGTYALRRGALEGSGASLLSKCFRCLFVIFPEIHDNGLVTKCAMFLHVCGYDRLRGGGLIDDMSPNGTDRFLCEP